MTEPLKIKWKTNKQNITPSEQFQNLKKKNVEKKMKNRHPNLHIYITVHFLALVHTLFISCLGIFCPWNTPIYLVFLITLYKILCLLPMLINSLLFSNVKLN